MLNGAPLGSTRTPRHAGDSQVVSLTLDNARGNDTDADARHELHGDPGSRVRILEVHDELGHILDGVHIMVRRWRDEANTWGGVARGSNSSDDLVARQLSALPRLRALCELDLDLVGIGNILSSDAKATRGHLLDLRANGVSLKDLPVRSPRLHGAPVQRFEAKRVFASLPGVALATDAIHSEGHGPVRFVGDGAEGDRPGAEALHYL
mmetsp:Transcript_40267/g.88045  ORF Transcript_40267/g.88045 Transcript_40267/m.88045 type:complete len:208 (+) Transcript_40267:208-831(+)